MGYEDATAKWIHSIRVCGKFVDCVEKTVGGLHPRAENEHDSDRQLWR